MTRKKRIVIGFSDFRQIIEAGGYFIDNRIIVDFCGEGGFYKSK